jgi:Domain of unknown function (DUF4193)
MSDEEFEENGAEVVDDLDEAELEDGDALEDDLDPDAEDDADLPAVVDLESGVPVEPTVPVAAPAAVAEGEEEEDVLELDEELHPDDVEAPLDALLQERTASATLEDEEEEVEEEEPDTDERGEGPTKIVPRRPGEFLCSSCFLVLPRNQLADEERMLCRDCA